MPELKRQTSSCIAPKRASLYLHFSILGKFFSQSQTALRVCVCMSHNFAAEEVRRAGGFIDHASNNILDSGRHEDAAVSVEALSPRETGGVA